MMTGTAIAIHYPLVRLPQPPGPLLTPCYLRGTLSPNSLQIARPPWARRWG